VGTARLTDRIPAEKAVAASVTRREITDVLQDPEAAVELTLDVVAADGSNEHGAISMTWSREDLEKLLEAATGDNVVLTFDRDELAAMLADVEAHGLRTRAAVFAVAAVGALGSGASIASAMPSGDEGGPVATPTTAVQTDTSQAALQARSEALNVQYGLGSSASDAIVTDASTGGGYVTPAASDAIVTDASTGGYATAGDEAQSALQARSEALNAQFGLGGSPSDATVTDASTGGYVATPTATGGGGIEIQRPSTDEALLAGAALLTIAGAAFAARRTGAPRPA
jgi:hypothetical protein